MGPQNFSQQTANEIIEGCKDFLQYYYLNAKDSEQYIAELEHKILHYLQGHDKIVLCGKSTFSVYIHDHLVSKYGKDVQFCDSVETLDQYLERLPIITTAKYFEDYAVVLLQYGYEDILNYNQLFFLDSIFDIPNNQFRNHKHVQACMKHILKHAKWYSELLEQLQDLQSKELLARIIMYRLTMNGKYCCGIPKASSQYFDNSLIVLNEQEQFVDAGGFNGDTLQEFINVSGNVFKKYYFFEPVDNLLCLAKSRFHDTRIEFYPYCLWDENKKLIFQKSQYDNTQGHAVECSAEDQIEDSVTGVKMDDILCNKKVSFLKMDVEGAEIFALRGAKKIIERYHPKLTISAYHMPDDILEIVSFISSFGKYNLNLRTCEKNLDYDFIIYAT